MSRALFIIDPQNDFMDNPEKMGSLAVTGAMEDMKRLAQYIYNNDFDAIYVSIDSHKPMQIFHPLWWINSDGNNPNLFTVITEEDIINGTWKTANPKDAEWSLNYVRELKKIGKYELRIWPYHCIEGTEGIQVVNVIAQAITNWAQKTNQSPVYIIKGQNPNTEMFSCLKAEVIVPNAPETELNLEIINSLNSFSSIEVAGEAKSHCTGSSTNDLIEGLKNISIDCVKKVVILENCMSNVTGYEKEGDLFIENAKKAGCTIKQVPEIPLKNKIKI